MRGRNRDGDRDREGAQQNTVRVSRNGAGNKGHATLEWASRDIFYLHNDNASYSADDNDNDYTPAITQTHPNTHTHTHIEVGVGAGGSEGGRLFNTNSSAQSSKISAKDNAN